MQDKQQTTWQWTGYAFKAMNTKIQLWLYSQTDSAVLVDTQRLFHSFERRLSRFDPNSELSRLNACEREVFQASPTLLDAVEAALLAAQATAGLYDPTILDALERAGYDRSFEKIKSDAPDGSVQDFRTDWGARGVSPRIPPGLSEFPEILDAPAPDAEPGRMFSPHHTGSVRRQETNKMLAGHSFTFRDIQLNRARREIYRPSGLRLDLGGMGKGWTVDRAADWLQGLGPFLINAGGDIFGYHAPPGQRGWAIEIIHPLEPERFIAKIHLHHRALATSTIAKRRWRRNGRLMHHLIDPRTGRPARTDALSVSVVADRTVMAEVYAKTALILGAAQGLAYLQRTPGVEGLIYTTGAELLYTDGLGPILDRIEPAGYENTDI